MSTIPTPRTDNVQFKDRSDMHDPSAFDWFVRADFARTLERELTAANGILAKLQELHGCSREMVVHWCEHAAQRSCALEYEREKSAKLREVLTDVQKSLHRGWLPDHIHAAMDEALENTP